MKKLIEAEIIENTNFSGIYKMRLSAPGIAKACLPGQFVNLYTGADSMLLPRPISICAADDSISEIRLVYQIAGGGTELFSRMKTGQKIKLLGPLGNGFRISNQKSHTLIGGGIGVPPLLFLARTLRETNPDTRLSAYLGFRSKGMLSFLVNEFESLEVETHIASDDGTEGFKGNAVEMLREYNTKHDILYSCGPVPMLNAVSEYALANGLPHQLSHEERMACGLGACVGCVIRIKDAEGYTQKKVCSDGPVFCFDGKGMLEHV